MHRLRNSSSSSDYYSSLSLKKNEKKKNKKNEKYGYKTFDPTNIPRWLEELPELSILDLRNQPLVEQTINIEEVQVKILPSKLKLHHKPIKTWVWRYRSDQDCKLDQDTYIGPIIIANRNQPVLIRWKNNLTTGAESNVKFWSNSVDQTLHWANVNNLPPLEPCGEIQLCEPGEESPRCFKYEGPIPTVTHLHGGETSPKFDGHPDAWYTQNFKNTGSQFTGDSYLYENHQQAASIWYHDHSLGVTRLNVYAGLAGAYLLTDPEQYLPCGLTSTGLDRYGGHETTTQIIPLIIQDRAFDETGELKFNNQTPPNPTYHPNWIPEFIGDTIVVNGKTWPTFGTKCNPIERARYRFLMLDGSNARPYNVWLSDPEDPNLLGPPIWVIGTDGGYLDYPVKVQRDATNQTGGLLITPGERYDVIVDFADKDYQRRIGKRCRHHPHQLILRNDAPVPFKGETDPSIAFTPLGQLVKFWICSGKIKDKSYDPKKEKALRQPKIQRLVQVLNQQTCETQINPDLIINKVRQLTLIEASTEDGPLALLLNNSKWFNQSFPSNPEVPEDALYTEQPVEQQSEVWEFINLTEDAHPIHLHLVQFQILNRQNFNMEQYLTDWESAFGPENEVAVGCGPPGQKLFNDGFSEFTPQNLCQRYQFPGTPSQYNEAPIIGGNLDVNEYLTDDPIPPNCYELGWKDTISVPPGKVTRIVIRFSPQDNPIGETTPYPIDATDEPGYVWHCHILDHEDNEMMRRYRVLKNEPNACLN